MTLLILVVMIAPGVWCAMRQHRRLGALLFTATLILFLALGCGPVPVWLLNRLQMPYDAKPEISWGKRNAIVLLGAGVQKIESIHAVEPGMFSYPRITEAAALYNACRKTQASCKIVVSGGDAQHTGFAEANIYRNVLLRLDVNAADVLLEPDSMNTWQNAQFTRTVLQQYDPERVLLVSSGIHLRRSVLYFAHFGITVTPVRADYLSGVFTLWPLAYNFAVADYALHEFVGIARYHIYNALGLNVAKTLPKQTGVAAPAKTLSTAQPIQPFSAHGLAQTTWPGLRPTLHANGSYHAA
nr:YdcF family protein [Paraburkholderia hayleyella]